MTRYTECPEREKTQRLYNVLKDLLLTLEGVEDIEHDFFGCADKDCALCAAKKAVADLEAEMEKEDELLPLRNHLACEFGDRYTVEPQPDLEGFALREKVPEGQTAWPHFTIYASKDGFYFVYEAINDIHKGIEIADERELLFRRPLEEIAPKIRETILSWQKNGE